MTWRREGHRDANKEGLVVIGGRLVVAPEGYDVEWNGQEYRYITPKGVVLFQAVCHFK